jgi:hypothetical protein
LLLSATVHGQDFLSSELSSERTIALIERRDSDSKESASDSEGQTPEHQNWLFHIQGTEIAQGQPGFHSPYAGTNSLRSEDDFRQASSVDIFLGGHLWPGAEFKGKKIEMKDKGEVAYLLSFTAGKEFEATADGTKDTDVNLYVYDEAGKEVGKDDSPGPKCSVKVTPAKDAKYKFVITNAGGQHGDLRGKGRQVMTSRLSERPEDSSGSLVAGSRCVAAARSCNAPSRRGHS